ncbi:hypothetical protein SS50377_26989 [Spironucleus salmonicida]|uniref:Uncharacterized protein n=1 Tax=Spironucleus salmonicida TaxID=348837 RepID=V6LSC8_9EUKA|nr:hypothetical protein SS50377_26989 [Spironucleus salmonicida]|eukprot:EST47500.1 Hypothetical protein SS50377_12485 [Spironucleus salmonicida]
MQIPPSFSLYLMAKKKQQNAQNQFIIKSTAQPIEEVNVFHIPVSNEPYQIPGTKIGILTEEDLKPAQNTDHKEMLLDEVQAQLNLLKSVLRDNDKKENVKVSHDLQLEEAAQILSHTQQLELMNELVTVRKELQKFKSENSASYQQKEQEAILSQQIQQMQREEQNQVVQQNIRAKQIEERMKIQKLKINDENARQEYVRLKEINNQLNKSNNSYHSDHDEYPNRYIHQSQITEQIVTAPKQARQADIRSTEINPPYQSNIDELYNQNYVNSRSLEGKQRIICPQRKRSDHVDKLPHTDREKREIIKNIVDDVTYQEMQTTPQLMQQHKKRKQTYDDVAKNPQQQKQEYLQQLQNQIQDIETYDNFDQDQNYDKYEYINEPEVQRPVSKRQVNQQQQLTYYEDDYQQKLKDIKKQRQNREEPEVSGVKVFLPQIGKDVVRKLKQDQHDMQEANSSHLRFRKDIRKSTIGAHISDDIFNELFEKQLGLYLQTALEAAEQELNL